MMIDRLNNRRRDALLTGAAALTLICAASPALAQDTAPKELEEIVVTATRVETSINRVPISIAAYGQEKVDRQGMRNIDDVARMTPGVNFTRNSSTGSNISIRGISSGVGSATTGVYLDETPIQSRAVGSQPRNVYPNTFDVERIEVLRGPQGTLFGAGAEGGAIRFITRKPSLTDFSGYGRAEVAFTKSGDPSFEVGAAVGGPIVEDKVGFRVGAYHRRDGGYVDRARYLTNAVDDENANWLDTTNLRAAVTFQPTEWLTITPSINAQRIYSNDTNQVWEMLSDADSDDYVTGNAAGSNNEDEFVLSALDIEADLGWATFTSSTSNFIRNEEGEYDYTLYDIGNLSISRDVNEFYRIPGFYSFNLSGNKQNVWSQEFRLASKDPDARLTWVAGVYMGWARQSSVQGVQAPFFGRYLNTTIEAVYGRPALPGDIVYAEYIVAHDDQQAVFGEMTFAVTDHLKIIAGARYAETNFDFRGFATGPVAGGGLLSEGAQSEKPFTPKIGVEYRFNDDNMVYATASKGYRIGGANRLIPRDPRCDAALGSLGLREAPRQYESDSVWSYEVGSKNRTDDGRLRFAGSVYYIEWKNIIRNVGGLTGCPFAFITNLGDAYSKGFDAQIDLQATDNLTLGLAVGYNDAELETTIQPAGSVQPIARAGHTLGGSPWTINLNAQYNFEAFGDRPAYVRADFTYRRANRGKNTLNDPVFVRTYDPLWIRDPEIHDLRLRAGVKITPNADLSMFVNNALDEGAKLGRGRASNRANVFTYTAQRPLTVGMTAVFNY